jgi:Ca2+-binding RTX toxin-like protein
MLSRKARRLPWRRSIALAVILTAFSGAVAVAADTWIFVAGSSGNDTINESAKTGNYQIFGFAGKDTLTGSKGDNLIVGDGHCPPGTSDEDYCDVEEVPGDGGDTLRGGGGNNVIFGGGGPNTMYGGTGYNYIETGPSTNTIYGGPIGDAINATEGSGTINPGKGTNYIDVRSSGVYTVNCIGKNDTVYAYRTDHINHCAHVTYAGNNRDAVAAIKKAGTRKKYHAKKHHRTKKH